jgi:hypothetical protein
MCEDQVALRLRELVQAKQRLEAERLIQIGVILLAAVVMAVMTIVLVARGN